MLAFVFGLIETTRTTRCDFLGNQACCNSSSFQSGYLKFLLWRDCERSSRLPLVLLSVLRDRDITSMAAYVGFDRRPVLQCNAKLLSPTRKTWLFRLEVLIYAWRYYSLYSKINRHGAALLPYATAQRVTPALSLSPAPGSMPLFHALSVAGRAAGQSGRRPFCAPAITNPLSRTWGLRAFAELSDQLIRDGPCP